MQTDCLFIPEFKVGFTVDHGRLPWPLPLIDVSSLTLQCKALYPNMFVNADKVRVVLKVGKVRHNSKRYLLEKTDG